MDSATILVGEHRVTCVAKYRAWVHGCAVEIELLDGGKPVRAVHVSCARDQPDFTALSVLAPEALESLALRQFLAGQLGLKVKDVLDATHGIVPIISFAGPSH